MKNLIKKNIHDDPIIQAWRLVLHLWKPMAVWTLFVWAAIILLLVPISTGILGLQFFRRGEIVIGNEDLISWLFSPLGVSYVLLGITLTLTGWVVRFAGIFQIIADHIHGRRVSIRDTAIQIIRNIPLLIRLCLFIVGGGLVLVFPLIAGIGIIYEHFLVAYDINYYLSVKPVEWHLALIASAGLGLVWLLSVGYIFVRCLLFLPAYLHSSKSARESLIFSWRLSRRRSKKYLKIILLPVILWILILFIGEALFFTLSAGGISWISSYTDSMRILALITGFYIAGSALLDAFISFLGFSHISAIITRLYYDNYGELLEAPTSRPKFRKLAFLLKGMLQPNHLIITGVSIILASAIFSGYILEQIPLSNPAGNVKIAAHRAGPSPAFENTLEALELTLQTGAEYAEVDVQLTLDSVVVAVHDIDLMRSVQHPARIAETRYDSLEKIFRRMSSSSSGNESKKRSINTLDQFLDAAEGRIGLMIELKHPGPVLVQRVIAAIRQKEMEDDVVIMSMNRNAIHRTKSLAPEITVGFISALSVGNVNRLPVELLAMSRRSISSRLINESHRHDMEVYAWTINRASLMANMIEQGVDGIITDNPDLGIRVRDEMQELTAAERLLLQFQQFVAEDIIQ